MESHQSHELSFKISMHWITSFSGCLYMLCEAILFVTRAQHCFLQQTVGMIKALPQKQVCRSPNWMTPSFSVCACTCISVFLLRKKIHCNPCIDVANVTATENGELVLHLKLHTLWLKSMTSCIQRWGWLLETWPGFLKLHRMEEVRMFFSFDVIPGLQSLIRMVWYKFSREKNMHTVYH